MITTYASQSLLTRAARRAAFVVRDAYRCFIEAAYLHNEDAELIVTPSCGRILRYGPIGGPNFLWENPALPTVPRANLSFRAASERRWINFGGERAWPWPQNRWPQAMKRDWPPPAQLEQRAHELRVLSRCAVLMMSEPLVEFGLQVGREITLSPRGNCVALETRFHPTDTMRTPMPWAPWSITQIPVPTRIAARIDANTDLPGGQRPIGRACWEAIRRIGPDILIARCPANHNSKFGADGDLIAAEMGDYLFVQKRVSDGGPSGRRLSGEAVQVGFAGPDAEYAELEFTGKRGQAEPSLTVQWELLPWNPASTDGELAAAVRAM